MLRRRTAAALCSGDFDVLWEAAAVDLSPFAVPECQDAGTSLPGTAARSPERSVGVGAVGYALGAPVVHLAHGHVGKSAGSFGLRLASGGLMAAAIACAVNGADCQFLVVPALLGVPTVVAVDAAVIAREDVRGPSQEADASNDVTVWLGPSRGGAGGPGLGGGMRLSF